MRVTRHRLQNAEQLFQGTEALIERLARRDDLLLVLFELVLEGRAGGLLAVTFGTRLVQ